MIIINMMYGSLEMYLPGKDQKPPSQNNAPVYIPEHRAHNKGVPVAKTERDDSWWQNQLKMFDINSNAVASLAVIDKAPFNAFQIILEIDPRPFELQDS